MKTADKQVVTYMPHDCNYIEVGESACVIPLDHPGASNNWPVFTSTVLVMDNETGRFETRNTVYVRGEQ